MDDSAPAWSPPTSAPPMGLEQFLAVSTIFDAAEMVLYVADMETYELLFFNHYAEQLWGRDAVGRPCYKVLQSGQDGPCSFCTNPQLTTDGHACLPVVREFQNTVNNRWYLCIDKAIPWSDGRLVRMEVAIDISDRKAHEQFREQYVGLISHDLRSPLSSISLSASILKLLVERHGLSQAAAPVNTIQRNSQRMAEMIEDLLEAARLESGQLQLRRTHFDLNTLIADVARRLGAQASRSIVLETPEPAPVLADAARVERVIENLVGNAFRYSPEGTPVTVCVETKEVEVMVAIVDRGVGIAADELPKLFQRFYRATTSSAVNGLGLGLYNSRLIVEGHGGRIWAESVAGAGSTFRFTLPLGEQGG